MLVLAGMAARKSSPLDFNQIAARVVAQATKEKDPAAVALGRKGGLKGGKARAEALTPAKRKAIAKKAAKKRWKLVAN